MCYYNPAAGTSVPSDLWSCSTINGTLQVDITAANISYTQPFFAYWVFGDIEFYSSSLAPSKTTISFPFLKGIQGSMRFNFPDDYVANLTVQMNSLSCWAPNPTSSDPIMSLDFAQYQNIALNMETFVTNLFNATGGIEIKNKGMIDMSQAAIARVQSLTLTDVDIGGTNRFSGAFMNLAEVTDKLTISGANSLGGSGSQVMDWFPALKSVGTIELANNTVDMQFPVLQKLDSYGDDEDYGLYFAGNTGTITTAAGSGPGAQAQTCSCTSKTTGTCTVGGGNWVDNMISSLCYGGGYVPAKNPVCRLTSGSGSDNSDGNVNLAALAGWIIAIIVISVLCCIGIPLAICFGLVSCGAAAAANATQSHQTRIVVGAPSTPTYVPSSVAGPGQVPVTSPMAPGMVQPPPGMATVQPQTQPFNQAGAGADFHARRLEQQNGYSVAPPGGRNYDVPGQAAYNPPPPPPGALKPPSAPPVATAVPVDTVPPATRPSQELPSYEAATAGNQTHN